MRRFGLTDVADHGLKDDVNARRADAGAGADDSQNSHAARTPPPNPPTGPGVQIPALADVYASHSGFVWRTVRRFGVPPGSVEDVMHEVFLVVHRRLPDYDGRASVTTWLFHLTRGVVSNWRRGRRREAARLALVRPEPGAMPDPERETERSEAAAFVARFVESLDKDKRLVFELAEVDGLPIPEVAEVAGIKLNTAYSRLRAARREFQRAVHRLQAKRMRGAG